MVDIYFMKNLEEGRERGRRYHGAAAQRMLSIFSLHARPTDKSLLEIATRVRESLAKLSVRPYTAPTTELIGVYMGMYEPHLPLDSAVSRWLLRHSPKEYIVSEGGNTNPAVTERYMRNTNYYQDFLEAVKKTYGDLELLSPR